MHGVCRVECGCVGGGVSGISEQRGRHRPTRRTRIRPPYRWQRPQSKRISRSGDSEAASTTYLLYSCADTASSQSWSIALTGTIPLRHQPELVQPVSLCDSRSVSTVRPFALPRSPRTAERLPSLAWGTAWRGDADIPLCTHRIANVRQRSGTVWSGAERVEFHAR